MSKIRGLVASGIAVVSLSFPAFVSAGVYHCKDENGNQYYTQRKVHCVNPDSAVKFQPSGQKVAFQQTGSAVYLDQNIGGNGLESFYRYGYGGLIRHSYNF